MDCYPHCGDSSKLDQQLSQVADNGATGTESPEEPLRTPVNTDVSAATLVRRAREDVALSRDEFAEQSGVQ